jgi:hypothetical protein
LDIAAEAKAQVELLEATGDDLNGFPRHARIIDAQSGCCFRLKGQAIKARTVFYLRPCLSN